MVRMVYLYQQLQIQSWRRIKSRL